MPNVKAIVENSKSSINKIVDYETIINLYTNKFENWTVHIDNYLKSNKKYRETICKYNSKNLIKYSNCEEISLDLNIPKYFNEKDKNFYFGFTTKNINKFVTFYPYKIHCEVPKASLGYEFNFMQFRLIERFSKVLSLDNYLKKLVIVTEKEPYLSLDLTYFNFIDDNFLKFLKPNEIVNTNQTNNKLIYKLKNPCLEFQYFENNNLLQSHYDLPDDILTKLASEELNSWNRIINENKEDIDKMSIKVLERQSTGENKENFKKSQSVLKRKNTVNNDFKIE